MELREIIRQILQEGSKKSTEFTLGKKPGDKIYFKKLGYEAVLYKQSRLTPPGLYFNWQIIDLNSNRKNEWIATLWEDGKIQIKKPGSETFGDYYSDWGLKNFDYGIKSAVNYIWLNRRKSQKVVSEVGAKKDAEFSNVPLGKLVTFDSLGGWGAIGRKWNRIEIYSNNMNYMGVLLYDETDKTTTLHYAIDVESDDLTKETKWPGFRNVKNAVRYVYLQNQKGKIVDEITTNTEGDLMNYYNENPAELNNDYVDNYWMGLDNRNYFNESCIDKTKTTDAVAKVMYDRYVDLLRHYIDNPGDLKKDYTAHYVNKPGFNNLDKNDEKGVKYDYDWAKKAVRLILKSLEPSE